MYFAKTRRVWIGASDIESENTWKWVNGELVGSNLNINWAQREPNNEGDEDCAVITPIKDLVARPFYALDVGCNRDYFGLCEKKLEFKNL